MLSRSMRAPQRVMHIFNQPESLESRYVADLDDHMLSNIPGEDEWKEESTQHFWNPFLMPL